MSAPAALLYTVRVRLITDRPESYFDLTNIEAESEEAAIGYAISLATECFGLPLSHLACRVRSRQPFIDCYI